ncbi:hypothetical protein H1Q63_23660 [Desmonostoc muscorum CCALA 125]|nr:hypothetical protein [Desmonostoc muscorum CCALA 125]
MIFEKIRRGASAVRGLPPLRRLALRYRREYGTILKALVRYGLYRFTLIMIQIRW